MSDSPKKLNEKQIDNPTPATMRKELEGFFQHVLSHDPDDLQFTIMLAGHAEDGGTHMCTMVGGPPPMIARGISELLDTLIEKDPTFAIFFLLQMLSKMKQMGAVKTVNLTNLSQFDNTGGDDIAKSVEDFLSQLQGGSNDDGSTPPKGNLH